MMTIETDLKPSQIQGLGIFAKHMIPKGTVVWRFSNDLDRRLRPEEVEALGELEKKFFDHFCYQSPQTGLYMFLVDNYRFTNHSSDPNIIAGALDEFGESIDVAARDILPGEELTYNYGYFGEAI